MPEDTFDQIVAKYVDMNVAHIYTLLSSAITDKINDRETFMKGIDYSYYYEQED